MQSKIIFKFFFKKRRGKKKTDACSYGKCSSARRDFWVTFISSFLLSWGLFAATAMGKTLVPGPVSLPAGVLEDGVTSNGVPRSTAPSGTSNPEKKMSCGTQCPNPQSLSSGPLAQKQNGLRTTEVGQGHRTDETRVRGEKLAFRQSQAEAAPTEAAVMAHLAKGNSPPTRVKIVAKKTARPHLPPPALRAAVFG